MGPWPLDRCARESAHRSSNGVRIHFFDMNSAAEPYIIPGLILIGILAGLLPAIMAYRTDVSKSLSQ